MIAILIWYVCWLFKMILRWFAWNNCWINVLFMRKIIVNVHENKNGLIIPSTCVSASNMGVYHHTALNLTWSSKCWLLWCGNFVREHRGKLIREEYPAQSYFSKWIWGERFFSRAIYYTHLQPCCLLILFHQALMLEVCDETEIAELKLKV